MLNSMLNKKVKIALADYAKASCMSDMQLVKNKGYWLFELEATIVDMDDNFIKLDNDMIIAIKYITYIKSL